MGIPKLLQDLRPYAEDVNIGRCPDGSTLPTLEKVVIDGPSMVHFVYSRILRRRDPSSIGVDVQPSYKEISVGVVKFLRDLLSRDIDMLDRRFSSSPAS